MTVASDLTVIRLTGPGHGRRGPVAQAVGHPNAVAARKDQQTGRSLLLECGDEIVEADLRGAGVALRSFELRGTVGCMEGKMNDCIRILSKLMPDLIGRDAAALDPRTVRTCESTYHGNFRTKPVTVSITPRHNEDGGAGWGY